MMKKLHCLIVVITCGVSAASFEQSGAISTHVNLTSTVQPKSVHLSQDSTSTTSNSVKSLPPLEPKGYLTYSQISVADLFPNVTIGDLSVSVVDGPNILIKVGSDGIIRYLSPKEQGKDTTTTLEFKDAVRAFRAHILMPWSSRLGSPISEINEGSSVALASLHLSMDGGVLPGYFNDDVSSVVYMLQSPEKIYGAHSEISIEKKTDSVDVTNWFDINPTASTLTLKNEYLTKFKQAVKEAGFVSVVFSLSTQHYESTYGFESGLQYAGASLTVKLINEQGEAATSTSGDHYIVTGLNSGLKVLATVNDDGQFLALNLPVDTYSIEEVLLEPGVPVVGFYVFDDKQEDATITIVTEK